MQEGEVSLFSLKEVAELMARKAGKTEGHWGVYFGFGLGASNVGADDQNLAPAAITVITQIGLQRFSAPNNMTIDASTFVTSEEPERPAAAKAGKRKAK